MAQPDIAEVYGSIEDFAEIEPILQDYGVQIIYVGALERVIDGVLASSMSR